MLLALIIFCLKSFNNFSLGAKPSICKSLSLFQIFIKKSMRLFCKNFAKYSLFLSSNQKLIQLCTYSVGRYSLCGVSHSTSFAIKSGVPPEPLKPTKTPAWASIRIAAWVIDVPPPNKIQVVLAMGIFQYCLLSCSSVRYKTRPSFCITRHLSR
ncbi:hypothetical protein MNB_SUP05-5-777 [hydrothermal vent metagenome]|uniref:Uncharacterized protein n=1 Tax=hydrothermal vent metagenome TaxID=652676 RepID=A0A1W1BXC8_9ZZZZ